jgi:hypothetical protein
VADSDNHTIYYAKVFISADILNRGPRYDYSPKGLQSKTFNGPNPFRNKLEGLSFSPTSTLNLAQYL